ncbi:membrane protein [Herbidospora sp. NBRC 101105]|nr:membrane protein [Herbidospora sp. NBRC 101105]
MSHINHFSHGALTPLLAYLMSVVGSLLGLILTTRARSAQGASRYRWLAGGALAIGGTGIWVMHFIAMMGFDVDSEIRFDVGLTAISAIVAVGVVYGGLHVVSRGDGLPRLLAGGLLAGAGVGAMHYIGMFAMSMSGTLAFDPVMVALSVLIAIVAATVALWFTLKVEGPLATTGAALMMGVAVTGMHYTGMYALSVTPGDNVPRGAAAMDFLLPLIAGISLITVGLLLAILLSPSAREMREDSELLERLQHRRTTPATPPPPPAPQRRQDGDDLFTPRR